MNPLTEAREHVEGVLTALGVTCYPYPPDAPALPAAWLLPDGTWARPRTLATTTVNLRLQVANGVGTRNRDALNNLEERSWAILKALRQNQVEVTDVQAPATQTLGQVTASVVELSISVTIQDT